MSTSLFKSGDFTCISIIYSTCITVATTFLLRMRHSFGKVVCHIHCALLKKYGILYCNSCGKRKPLKKKEEGAPERKCSLSQLNTSVNQSINQSIWR